MAQTRLRFPRQIDGGRVQHAPRGFRVSATNTRSDAGHVIKRLLDRKDKPASRRGSKRRRGLVRDDLVTILVVTSDKRGDPDNAGDEGPRNSDANRPSSPPGIGVVGARVAMETAVTPRGSR